MKVLEDPLTGPACRSMFEEGEVDDRFLVMVFLTVERLRKNSTWKPYLDMLPTEFGSTLWFSDDDLLELKGTRFQVRFEDFLWANSIFWTRALNIPFPSSYVFRTGQPERECGSSNSPGGFTTTEMSGSSQVSGSESASQADSIFVEGLVPGIDFCNHDIKGSINMGGRWKRIIDGNSFLYVPSLWYNSSTSGVIPIQGEKEISISYGAKGNELHYPVEAISDMPFSEGKLLLFEEQKGVSNLPKTEEAN
ncbi:hypothetical protein SASPL_112212 [Salvia splendens]|uniref:SET domain-containing protein n=1 Tax=Salvia splendens TaxID=180675 RepID=A0A8X9A5V9_SALSN|nr:hypothetical protein SASPL_112212 [Salvia splendens]